MSIQTIDGGKRKMSPLRGTTFKKRIDLCCVPVSLFVIGSFLFKLTLALLRLNPNHKYAGSNILSKIFFLCLLFTKNGVSHLNMGINREGGGGEHSPPGLQNMRLWRPFLRFWVLFQVRMFLEVFAKLPPENILLNTL